MKKTLLALALIPLIALSSCGSNNKDHEEAKRHDLICNYIREKDKSLNSNCIFNFECLSVFEESRAFIDDIIYNNIVYKYNVEILQLNYNEEYQFTYIQFEYSVIAYAVENTVSEETSVFISNKE